MVKKAMESVAADMVLSPKMGAMGYDTVGSSYDGGMSMADLFPALRWLLRRRFQGLPGNKGTL